MKKVMHRLGLLLWLLGLWLKWVIGGLKLRARTPKAPDKEPAGHGGD